MIKKNKAAEYELTVLDKKANKTFYVSYSTFLKETFDSEEEELEFFKKEYLLENKNCEIKNIRKKKINEGFKQASEELIDYLIKKKPEISKEALMFGEHYFMLQNNETRKGSLVVPLSEAKKIIEEDDYSDFVYLKPLEVVVFNVIKQSSHEIFMAYWNKILTKIFVDNVNVDETFFDDFFSDIKLESELFIQNKFGFFMSSSLTKGLIKSSDYKLTAQEKIVFEGMKFRDIEPLTQKEINERMKSNLDKRNKAIKKHKVSSRDFS